MFRGFELTAAGDRHIAQALTANATPHTAHLDVCFAHRPACSTTLPADLRRQSNVISATSAPAASPRLSPPNAALHNLDLCGWYTSPSGPTPPPAHLPLSPAVQSHRSHGCKSAHQGNSQEQNTTLVKLAIEVSSSCLLILPSKPPLECLVMYPRVLQLLSRPAHLGLPLLS